MNLDEYEKTADVFRDLANKFFIYVIKDSNGHVIDVTFYKTEDTKKIERKFLIDTYQLYECDD